MELQGSNFDSKRLNSVYFSASDCDFVNLAELNKCLNGMTYARCMKLTILMSFLILFVIVKFHRSLFFRESLRRGSVL